MQTENTFLWSHFHRSGSSTCLKILLTTPSYLLQSYCRGWLNYDRIYLFAYFGSFSKIFLIFWKGRSTRIVRRTDAATSTTTSGTSACNKESTDAIGRS